MIRTLKFSNTASSKLQSEINKSIVLNYLRENKYISRATVARDLNISAPTVSKIVEGLIKEGYVIEIGKDKSTGGKRPTMLNFNSDIGCVIGVDLGKDKFRIARSNLSGDILDKYVGFEIFYKDKELLNKIVKEVESFINKINLSDSQNQKIIPLKAICIGVPAIVDINTGKVIGAPLFEGWENLNIKEVFAKRFNLQIFVENSTNISAIGENYYGEGKRFSDLIYLEVSEGIGAGLIIDNRLFRGSYSSSGEVAFTVSGLENLYSTYKYKGYMEEVASPRCIKREAIKAIKDGKKTLLSEIISNNLTKIDSSIVCKAALLGDSLSNKIIKNIVENLAIIVINLTLIVNPQIIVIGGDICALPEVDKLFINPIKDIVKNVIPFKSPEIKISLLGEDTGILGSTFFAIDNLLTKEFPYKIKKERISQRKEKYL
jgi:predicted NBD/HSP70 family sugar kinase